MNQISGATPADPPAQAEAQPQAAPAPDPAQQPDPPASGTGFGSRGRARRRLRFLRKARELAYRDLGGLVFNLHRFGQRNDPLVLDKLNTLGHIDREVRGLESTLSQPSPVTVLREAGITACPRCAAIHSSEDHFCPNCGIAMGRHADLPIAGAAAATAPQPAQAPAPLPAPPASAAPAPQPPAHAPPPQPPAPAQTAAPFAASAPVKATEAAPAPAAGRSPTPPHLSRPQGDAAPVSTEAKPGGEELTEILRPPAPGS